MINSIIKVLFRIKIQPYNSKQEKKRQRIYHLLNAETKQKFLCVLYTKQRKICLKKKIFFRKHAMELEVHEKTGRIAIK